MKQKCIYLLARLGIIYRGSMKGPLKPLGTSKSILFRFFLRFEKKKHFFFKINIIYFLRFEGLKRFVYYTEIFHVHFFHNLQKKLWAKLAIDTLINLRISKHIFDKDSLPSLFKISFQMCHFTRTACRFWCIIFLSERARPADSRHQGAPLKPPRSTQHYRIEGFKGNILIGRPHYTEVRYTEKTSIQFPVKFNGI